MYIIYVRKSHIPKNINTLLNCCHEKQDIFAISTKGLFSIQEKVFQITKVIHSSNQYTYKHIDFFINHLDETYTKTNWIPPDHSIIERNRKIYKLPHSRIRLCIDTYTHSNHTLYSFESNHELNESDFQSIFSLIT